MISIISGTAGVGKTTPAVHWAYRVAAEFPDGEEPAVRSWVGHAPDRVRLYDLALRSGHVAALAVARPHPIPVQIYAVASDAWPRVPGWAEPAV